MVRWLLEKMRLSLEPSTAGFLVIVLLTMVACSGDRESSEVIIYTARQIITMDPEQPRAEAVAVQGARIVGVGALSDLQEEHAAALARVDRRFNAHILLPGFIDPHIHPTIAASILPMEIVAAMEWPTIDGSSKPVRSEADFAARLLELDAALPETDWLMAWGYHAPYHGRLDKRRLDAISDTRPIMIWQRSIHEMYFNSAALNELGLTEEDFAAEPHASWENGHIWEAGLFSLGGPMMAKIASPLKYLKGLSRMSELIHRGGITTVGEQGFPQVNSLAELWALRWELRKRPYRFVLIPNAMYLSNEYSSLHSVVEAAEHLLTQSTEKVRFSRHIKYYSDGAMFSQMMQMTEPYIDGHQGEWMMPPESQSLLLEAFWRADWDIHIHVNGDAGLDRVLMDIARMKEAFPDKQPRIVLEHYGYAREDQHAQVAQLGIEVSNNPYYLYELAPIYSEHGLGPERAKNLSPLGGLSRAGVRFSFHSDFSMAPLQPLKLAWVATNREASDGNVWGREQRVSAMQALTAVTIEAARSLGMEASIGSISTGKLADFTVLGENPLEVPIQRLKDIPIWGTIFEGELYPLDPN